MNQIVAIETGTSFFDVPTPNTWLAKSGYALAENLIVSPNEIVIPGAENAVRVPIEVQQSFTIALGLSLEFE